MINSSLTDLLKCIERVQERQPAIIHLTGSRADDFGLSSDYSASSPSQPGTDCKLKRCRIVGRPCGQFQGCSISLMWWSRVPIIRLSSAFPTIMDDRHARDASMPLTLDGLTKQPGRSTSSATISSMSSSPNVTFLL
eukprot:m.8677 g.8677  ORF g.8677 m.8677 type:complete len:137 (+) comp9247_c0_seq1:47-457(+)